MNYNLYMSETTTDIYSLLEYLGNILSKKNQTITTAESCTGGWVGKEITGISGSSKWFGSGFITYSNSAKVKILRVNKETLLKEGAVSENVVKEMAIGAMQLSRAEYGIAISGLAGPGGGTKEKPVGTVCFAVGNQDKINTSTKLFSGDRDQVRVQSVQYALTEMNNFLKVLHN
ncbi:MAG: CinA family protein [Gammaproteobacteria bacterium]|tara:strand:- start:99 stop:620 length:522 start_codon:yes stop_codon:yes gene_type:complete